MLRRCRRARRNLALAPRRICVVPQEGFLFNGTIRDNVRIAKEGASDAEVDEALRAIAVFDRFCELPEGLETEVRSEGPA